MLIELDDSKSIYEYICRMAEENCTIDFDMPDKRIKLNNVIICEYQKDTYTLYTHPSLSTIPLIQPEEIGENWKEQCEKLYLEYANSVKSIRKLKTPFVAKRETDLALTEMFTGVPRNYARVRLLAFIILGALSGNIKWDNLEKHYWYSNNVKELFLSRNWIVLNENRFVLN